MSRTRLPLSVSVALPVAGLVVALGLVGCSRAAGTPAAQPSASVDALRPPPQEQRASVVLREWDERRASAYASGSEGELRRLYVDGSPAGRSDVRLLRAYADRGLVVAGMRMQVLAVDVLHETRTSLRLRVTDRVVGAVARGPAGALPLPRDSPSTRVLALRSVDGVWRMAAVIAAREPAVPRGSGARR